MFDPKKHYKTVLTCAFDGTINKAVLPGHFRANTIKHYDPLTREREFAIFEVDKPEHGEYPFHWYGVYTIPMGQLRVCPPEEI